MILTVTLNPCLDKSLFIPRNVPAETLRCDPPRDLAGGKGVNVARALRRLGLSASALMPLGGHPGRQTAELCRAEGLTPIAVPIAGVTRQALTIQETETGRTWHYLEPGPTLTPGEIGRLRKAYLQAVGQSELVIIAGSVPCPELAPVIPWMIEQAREAGRDTIVDTHGPALRAALEARPWMVKPNREELEEALELSLAAEADRWRALERLRERGICVAVLSLGAEGLRCRWGERGYAATPPRVAEVNPLGGGDSLVAGIAVARLRGQTPENCLRFGVACGAANAAVWDPGGVEPVRVAALLSSVTLQEADRDTTESV